MIAAGAGSVDFTVGVGTGYYEYEIDEYCDYFFE